MTGTLNQRPSRAGLGALKALAFVAAVFSASMATAQTRSIELDDGVPSRLELDAGFTMTVETDQPFADILIGNTNILDVFPLTDTSLYLQSKGFGRTNVTLYSPEQRLLEVIDVKIRADYSDLRAAIASAVPSGQVVVTNVNNRIRLSGEVKDSVDLNRVLRISQQYSSEPVINSLRVKTAQQVELDVRIIEVNRNSGRELGVDLEGTRNGEVRFESSQSSIGTDQPFGRVVGELLTLAGTRIDFTINALEARGLARRLANPKLVTTSGTEANFVVGGEVPINTSDRDDDGSVTQSTTYREFGVRLNFTPTVLDDELVRLRIAPEVSDIDESIDVNGNPGFITRKAETTVSLRSGQSFAIAGLLQANNSRNVDQIPWLGQVPVLGTLFRSTEFQKRESDLVILVTPRLVRPATPNEPLATPLDQTRSSNDVELFLLGMLEVDRKLLRGFREGEGVVGPYGHMIDLEFDDAVINKK
ncbi:MAG: type II and III secretion system protein family protein [Boseongicola sp.]|nr:type II and III secretion system protein family protein [Boseongicola sp.]